MDSAGDAVLHLDVELGELVLVLVDGSLSDITLCGSLDDVADKEALDSLILGNAATAV